MIATSGQLVRQLSSMEDNFVFVECDGKEYVIDCVGHSKTYGDQDLTSHLILKTKDGGDGYIRR